MEAVKLLLMFYILMFSTVHGGYIPYQKTHIKELEDRIEHLRELKVPVKDSSAELEPPGAGYPGGASTSERRNRDRPGR